MVCMLTAYSNGRHNSKLLLVQLTDNRGIHGNIIMFVEIFFSTIHDLIVYPSVITIYVTMFNTVLNVLKAIT